MDDSINPHNYLVYMLFGYASTQRLELGENVFLELLHNARCVLLNCCYKSFIGIIALIQLFVKGLRFS